MWGPLWLKELMEDLFLGQYRYFRSATKSFVPQPMKKLINWAGKVLSIKQIQKENFINLIFFNYYNLISCEYLKETILWQ